MHCNISNTLLNICRRTSNFGRTSRRFWTLFTLILLSIMNHNKLMIWPCHMSLTQLRKRMIVCGCLMNLTGSNPAPASEAPYATLFDSIGETSPHTLTDTHTHTSDSWKHNTDTHTPGAAASSDRRQFRKWIVLLNRIFRWFTSSGRPLKRTVQRNRLSNWFKLRED